MRVTELFVRYQSTDGAAAEIELLIPKMVCEGCTEKLDDALQSVAGVREARADAGRRRVRVRYEPLTAGLGQLKAAVAAAGLTAVEA